MEGPSLVILREELSSFEGKKILAVEGNSKQDIQRLSGKKILTIRSWGKHLILQFKDFSVRIHFLMFGSYRINERKEGRSPRLSLQFAKGEINFYSCSVLFIEEDLDLIYDWELDLLSDSWNKKKVFARLEMENKEKVCDVLMNQEIFPGLGNIIKNEVLFILHLHPKTILGKLTKSQKKKLVEESRKYAENFYTWKKAYQLKKHFAIYGKRTCPRCGIPVIKEPTGKGQRRSFYCISCQWLYE